MTLPQDISIYVCYHEPTPIIADPVFKYIYCGAAINGAENYIPGTLRDDAGDNISRLNKSFCELTAIYWAWKNDTRSSYIGFMHYRRHLNFSGNDFSSDRYGLINHSGSIREYADKFGLQAENVCKAMAGFDIILPEKWNVKNIGHKNIYAHYAKSLYHHMEDYRLALDESASLFPAYVPAAEKFSKNPEAYFNNMFIMTRQAFHRYCEYIFPVLLEISPKIRRKYYSVNENRAEGYIGERLLNIFIEAERPRYKIKELPRTYIENFEEELPTNDNSITIVTTINDEYAKYADVFIKSLQTHISPARNYTVHILHAGLTEKNMGKLSLNSCNNFHIKFYNVKSFFKNHKLPTHHHFTPEVYYRLAIPEIFSGFKKVLYLDSDILVQTDAAELYELDMGNMAVAGVHDYIMTVFVKRNTRGWELAKRLPAGQYIAETLNIAPEEYIQAGVLLFNIPVILENNLHIRMKEELGKRYWFNDQDIINKVCKGRKHFLDMSWNIAHGNGDLDTFFADLPAQLHDEFFLKRKNPKIIHFAGNNKPWLMPEIEFGDEFWRMARQSIFYEEILASCAKFQGRPKIRKFIRDKLKAVYRKIRQGLNR